MNELRIILESFLVDTFHFRVSIAALIVTLIAVVFWLILGLLISGIVGRLIARYFEKKKGATRGKTLGTLTKATFKAVLWFIIFLAVLAELGFDITPILATAAILGLAIGFGAQNLVRDVISGFFTIVDNKYNIGETVEIGGFRGTVTEMNLRVTVLENWMGSVLVLNNGNITQVTNWSRKDTIALVDFGVDYATDLEKVAGVMPELMKQLHENHEEILEEPSFLGVTALADSSINMRIMAKTKNGKHWMIERKIRHALVKHLSDHEIAIPFPQLVVHDAKTK